MVGGRRRNPRARQGADVKIGPAARNSFSRMPGSWFGIAGSRRIRGWQGVRPVCQIGVHRDQHLVLDLAALIRGFRPCAPSARRPDAPTAREGSPASFSALIARRRFRTRRTVQTQPPAKLRILSPQRFQLSLKRRNPGHDFRRKNHSSNRIMIFSPRLPTQAPKTKITPHVTNQTHPTGQLRAKRRGRSSH
jgi:hypothetical protein